MAACTSVSCRRTRMRISCDVLGIAIVLNSLAAFGQEPVADEKAQPSPTIEEIVVFGRSLELIGAAQAASEGTIGGADLLVRPMLRVAELLEAVPGMVAVQHSGSGKANQYFLRGLRPGPAMKAAPDLNLKPSN